MRRPLRTRTHREEGASAVEYGLLVAAIAAVIVLIVFGLGLLVKGTFSTTSSSIDACMPPATCP